MVKRPRLSKSELHSLESYKSWLGWGERFGFKLYGANDEWLGDFMLPDGTHFLVPKLAREAIDSVTCG